MILVYIVSASLDGSNEPTHICSLHRTCTVSKHKKGTLMKVRVKIEGAGFTRNLRMHD